MTVQELIRKLEQCDPDKVVRVPALIYSVEVNSVSESNEEVEIY